MTHPLYRFCPRCGHKLSWKREYNHASHEPRRPVCNSCGFVYYETSAPTASALIINTKKEVLLAKRAWPPLKGHWDIIGGFLEATEHPEHGVRREIKEEIGVPITIKRLLGVWMDRYFYNNHWRWTMNFYFIAMVTSGTPKASDDVAEVKWFKVSRLPKNIAGAANRAALKAMINDSRKKR